MPEPGTETSADEEEVSKAGPRTAILFEHQGQLERGQHTGVVDYPVQFFAHVFDLQIDIQDAAP